MNKISFIGTGKMGGALAAAAAANPENTVILANRHREKAEVLAAKIGASVADNNAAVSEGNYVFIGVKPQMMDTAFDQIRDALLARPVPAVIVSMMAGVSIETILAKLGKSYPVIRIMPNIPVSVGEGMILYTANDLVSDIALKTFLAAMEHAGRFAQVEEKMIDLGSGVTGCGPAFAAMFIEALADGGVACGLPRKEAVEYAAQMLVGSAKYILENDIHPGELKDSVCSPGGTTIQGVRTLENAGFRSAVIEAVITSSTYKIQK